jgi:hypothetical protein
MVVPSSTPAKVSMSLGQTDPRERGGGWIGVDFDGTLATYTEFKGEGHTGEPIEPMVRKVRVWLREGRDVRLFTARKPHPNLRKWMKEHLGEVLKITNIKDRFMVAFYDDRAVSVERNTGKVDEKAERQAFAK